MPSSTGKLTVTYPLAGRGTGLSEASQAACWPSGCSGERKRSSDG
jgi:hypothetical protein